MTSLLSSLYNKLPATTTTTGPQPSQNATKTSASSSATSFSIESYIAITCLHKNQSTKTSIHLLVLNTPLFDLHQKEQIISSPKNQNISNHSNGFGRHSYSLPYYIVEKRNVSRNEWDMTKYVRQLQMDRSRSSLIANQHNEDAVRSKNENGKRWRSDSNRMSEPHHAKNESNLKNIQRHYRSHFAMEILQMDEIHEVLDGEINSSPIRRIFTPYYPLTLHQYMAQKRRHYGSGRLKWRDETSHGNANVSSQSPTTLPFSVDEIKFWTTSILSIVAELHSEGIIHRDVKPANIFLEESTEEHSGSASTRQPKNVTMEYLVERHLQQQDSPQRLKPHHTYSCRIGDFEFAKHVIGGELSHSQLGTMDFLSPEIVNGQHYDEKVDCWAVGVILLEMLLGRNPFQYQLEKKMRARDAIKQISSQLEHIDVEALLNPLLEDGIIEECAVDFVCGLLDRNTSSRLSADEALQHEFISGRFCSEQPNDNYNTTEQLSSLPTADFPVSPSFCAPIRGACHVMRESMEYPRWFFVQPGREWTFKSVLKTHTDVLRHTFFLERQGHYQLYVGIKSSPGGGIWKYFRAVTLKMSGQAQSTEEIVIKENSKLHDLPFKSDSAVQKLQVQVSIRPENLIGFMIWSDWVEFDIRLMWCGGENGDQRGSQ